MASIKYVNHNIFSPGGRLMQVECAHNAAKMGSTVVGVCGRNCVVLGVEKRVTSVLQIDRTTKNICQLYDHIAVGYAGLAADARVIVQRAMIECESYFLCTDEEVTTEYISRFIADLKYRYTRVAAFRPYGVVCLIGGVEADGLPHLFETQPSGDYFEWKANAIGRYQASVLQFLEANYNEEIVETVSGTIKLALKGLLHVVKLERNNFQICVIEKEKKVVSLTNEEIVDYVNQIQ